MAPPRHGALAIDFDSTLVTTVGENPTAIGSWKPGAREALREFVNDGWYIVIHTCRATWFTGSYPLLRDWLDQQGFTSVEIWTEPGKPIADLYIDDRGYHFDGDWGAVREHVRQMYT